MDNFPLRLNVTMTEPDPAVCGGQVCVKGTRIPASLILGAMAGGDVRDWTS